MGKKLRFAFAGTPMFADAHLRYLLNHQYCPCAIFTAPDRPAGRGQKLTMSPVKKTALEYGIETFQPNTFKSDDVIHLVTKLQLDVVIDVAYGFIIPQNMLTIPSLGFVNVHPSLLPRWRGAAPIQRAILAGDEKTGISIMQLAPGIDTGPVFSQVICDIHSTDTAATLENRLSQLSAKSLFILLQQLEDGTAVAMQQSKEGVTYAYKIEKAEAAISWGASAIEIDRLIRAFNPWPIAFTQLGEHTVRIWKAQLIGTQSQETPGTIIRYDASGIEIATGNGVLKILEMQFPGSKVLPVREILNGKKYLFEQYSFFR